MPKSNSTPTHHTVLITGASSGIGRAAALYLAERGYPVVGTSRSLPRLAGLLGDARRRELPVYGAELDVNSDAAVERAMPQLAERHGPIGALVNNAGYGLWGPAAILSSDELRAQFETNLFAAQRLIRAVLPAMLERRSGTIINISSVLGRLGTPFNGAYVASKFALEGLSESLRTELWPFGVRVAVVEPGLFKTDFIANQVTAAQADDEGSPFFPYVRRYRERSLTMHSRAADPVKVAKVIHKIIRSRRPAFRYPVSPEARLGGLGARLMPERLFFYLLGRFTMR